MRQYSPAITKETSANQNITSTASKLLDSSSATVSAPGAIMAPRYDGGKKTVSTPEPLRWYYMVLRSKDLRQFSAQLSEQFTTYLYTAVDHQQRVQAYTYSEEEYEQRQEAAKTMAQKLDHPQTGALTESTAKRGSGYLFIRACQQQLNAALLKITPRRYLAKDKATDVAAVIPDKQMKDFMMVYELAPWNIRFMDHPIADYAKGHDLIRITGGVLEGAEGYIVRINKDRKLVLSIGNMTLAVSDIHSYPYEPVSKS